MKFGEVFIAKKQTVQLSNLLICTNIVKTLPSAIFDRKFRFSLHVQLLIAKVRSMIDFIHHHSSKEFNDPCMLRRRRRVWARRILFFWFLSSRCYFAFLPRVSKETKLTLVFFFFCVSFCSGRWKELLICWFCYTK